MRRSALFFAMAVLVLAAAVPAQAQPSEPGPHGYRPWDNSFQFRFGGFFPSGGGGMWEGNESAFTMNASDFNNGTLGFTWVVGMSNNLEIGFNLDFYESTVRSSYRDWADEGGYPIYHDTSLRLMPATVDFRFLPAGRYSYRGREGQYRVHQPVPYFGAGAGFNFWEYQETGDFLNFDLDPPEVFPASFSDEGVAFEAHVLAGIEIPMGPTWGLILEGRYSWSDDTPSADFSGLGSLDMGGTSAYLGAAFHF